MGVTEHLEQVRTRLIVSVVAVLATTVLAYAFSDVILLFLRAPAGNLKLIGWSPMDGFMIHLHVAIYGGLVLAAPIWIYQLVRFVEPALLPNEKRVIIPGVVAAVVLFLAGNGFGYLMLRNMMGALFFMYGSELTYMPGAEQYISFVVLFLIGTGLAFELPIAMLIGIKLGLLSPQFLRKQRKIAYFVIFVFAEVITPVTDPLIAPTVVMLPMVLLFELALFSSKFIVPKPVPVSIASGSTAE